VQYATARPHSFSETQGDIPDVRPNVVVRISNGNVFPDCTLQVGFIRSNQMTEIFLR